LNLPPRPPFTSLKRGVNEKAPFMIGYYGCRERVQLAGAVVGAGRSTATANSTPNASRGSARNLAQSARFSGIGLQCYVAQAASCTVPGLTSGTQYWLQVCAITPPPQRLERPRHQTRHLSRAESPGRCCAIATCPGAAADMVGPGFGWPSRRPTGIRNLTTSASGNPLPPP
jgi:hypothetical protein